MVASEMLPELTLWAIGAEGEGCLYPADRYLAGGSCCGGGDDTGKSGIWSVFTLPALCPVVLFCPVVLNLAYSDFTQQMLYLKHKRPSARFKPKTLLFGLLFGLFFHLDLLLQGIFVSVDLCKVATLITMMYLLPHT